MILTAPRLTRHLQSFPRGNFPGPEVVTEGMNREIGVPVVIGVVLLAIAGLFGVAVAAGLGGEGDSADVPATETPPPGAQQGGRAPEIDDGPSATLHSDGRSVTVPAGTRCWGSGGSYACVDMVGPISNSDPFVVERGASFTIEFEAGPPGETTVQWIPIGDAEPMDVDGVDEAVWMIAPTGDAEHRDPGVENIDVEPGEYLYTVFAVYPGQGDVSYAFYLEVR